MTDYTTAIDVMYGVFKTAWDNGASPIIGYIPEVEYDEVSEANRAALSVAFARVTTRNVLDTQIGMGVYEAGAKLYASMGFVVVQIFVPKTERLGVGWGRELGTLVRNAFRDAGTDGEVWFKNATLTEEPPGARWRQFNVTVEYDFTETN